LSIAVFAKSNPAVIGSSDMILYYPFTKTLDDPVDVCPQVAESPCLHTEIPFENTLDDPVAIVGPE